MPNALRRFSQASGKITKLLFTIASAALAISMLAVLVDLLVLKRFGGSWGTVATLGLCSFMCWVAWNVTAAVVDLASRRK